MVMAWAGRPGQRLWISLLDVGGASVTVGGHARVQPVTATKLFAWFLMLNVVF